MLLTLFSTLTIVLSLSLVQAQGETQTTFQVFSNVSDIYPEPANVACATALSTNISCSANIIFTLPSSTNGVSNLTAAELTSLCTPGCYTSLTTAVQQIDAACKGWPYILGDTSYVASFPVRWLQYNYNLSCVSSGGNFCLNADQNSTSAADTDIATLPKASLCTDCVLKPLNIQMSSAFGWDANFVTEWSSIQTECAVSFNNTIPTGLTIAAAQNATTYNVSATPTLPPASTANCVFGSYTVKTGDTCQSIAFANSLSYDQLISTNGLDLNCTKLPAVGQPLCLSGKCSLYSVKAGDTCVQIYQNENITWSQLLAWNPQIDNYCSNIATQVGKGICISPPGGGYTPTKTVSIVTGTPTALATPTGNIAPGSNRANCGQWYEAISGDTCPQILITFGITNDTFYELNPDVNGDCSNLLAGFDYCVAVFGSLTTTSSISFPTSTFASIINYSNGDFPAGTGFLTGSGNVTATPVTGSPPVATPPPQTTQTFNVASGSLNSSSCLQYYTVQVGDTCLAITANFDITNAQFLTWNPEVNAGCTNIKTGFAYCVYGPVTYTTPVVTPTTSTTTTTTSSAPTNVASGTVTNGCNQYYTVQSGDSCGGVIDPKFNITLAQFLAWNPEINSGCTNIQAGLAYCVSGPTVTTTSAPAVSPTASGTITTGCKTYYTVVSGDTCPAIESKFTITFAQFQAWNPEVNSACSNIDVGLQYCVSGPTVTTTTPPAVSPTASGTITTGCKTYYTVVSGDTCPTIESKFTITFAQFQAWNPEVNSACSNIQIGLQYCVSGPAVTTTTTAPAVSPTASGTITTGCKTYYTVVSGDTCPAIESKFTITFAQFQAWNPEVNSACSNIQIGLQYCVSGPAVTTTTTTSPAAPTASGTLTTAQGCTKYYTTISGDNCGNIETKFSITLAQFLKWNPEINSGCTNLQVGLQYCVTGP